jgi:hypothetical protein
MSEDHFDSISVESQEKERGFNLPLPTIVEGQDQEGNSFKEQTSISYISQYGASFWLNTPTELDSELKLFIDLPPKLAEGQDLKLIIRGRVIFLESATDQNSKQRVSLKFENRYLIKNEDDSS